MSAPIAPGVGPQMCVECGAHVPRLIGGSCPTCFTKHTKLLTVPHVLDVEVCAHCDARHVGAHWFDPEEGSPLAHIREEALRGAVKVHEAVRGEVVDLHEQPQDERHFDYNVHMTGEVDGVDVEAEEHVLVRMRRSVCDRCSRMFGGYYAAIIQLRGTQRDVRPEEIKRAHRMVGDELDRIRAGGNREAFLTKSGAVPGGFDYQLGDIEGTRMIAKVVADRLGATVVETAKLVSRKEGEDIYRVTFLVRIKLFAKGDFAVLDDEHPVQVMAADRGMGSIVDLLSHKRNKVPETRLRRLGGPDILQEAVLVSQDSVHLQVMDPVSYQTVDMPRPEGYEAQGPTVYVLRHEERLYFPSYLPYASSSGS